MMRLRSAGFFFIEKGIFRAKRALSSDESLDKIMFMKENCQHLGSLELDREAVMAEAELNNLVAVNQCWRFWSILARSGSDLCKKTDSDPVPTLGNKNYPT
jgi:hypothetical protein